MRDHPLRQHLETQIQRALDLPHAYLSLQADEARLQLERTLLHPQQLGGSLVGKTVAVKDLFDQVGLVTLAGSALFGPKHLQRPPAQHDASAVTRLKDAGALMLGRTNMSEFAFSGVGINPHWGTPANHCDPTTPRIPGGSSSGSAVAVAAHAADIGLGSDTGGSLRIPAALCGIVGFKATAQSVPRDGCFPLSHSLDTVGVMTRSVAEVIACHEVLAQCRIAPASKTLAQCRIGVVRRFMTDDLDATVQTAWQRSLQTLHAAGAQLIDWDDALLGQATTLQSRGSVVAAEAYAVHREWLAQHAQTYDTRVLARIQLGAGIDANTYAQLLAARRHWITQINDALRGFDAMVAPTVPMVAPELAPIAPGAERDPAFFAVNSRLLRNPSAINLLDGCAISIPCHQVGELPVGLMIWHCGAHDANVLRIAQQIEALLQAPHCPAQP